MSMVLHKLHQILSTDQSHFLDDRATSHGHAGCSHQGALGGSPMFDFSHHHDGQHAQDKLKIASRIVGIIHVTKNTIH
jgi:hypothetical protein